MTDPAGFDIVTIVDARASRARGLAVAEEIRAQHEAGYRTAIVSVGDTGSVRSRPLNDDVMRTVREDLASLPRDGASLRARLTVVHHAPAFIGPPDAALRVQTEQLVLVLHDEDLATGDVTPADLTGIASVCEKTFGATPVWAASGPAAHDLLTTMTGKSIDWPEVIDAGAWASAKAGGPRLVTGRHDAAGTHGWPADAEALADAYPADGSVDVRILGDTTLAARVSKTTVAAWRHYPAGSILRRDFLAALDVFVWLGDERATWIPVRPVLEAMAGGCVPVVPEQLAGVVGDAGVVASPAEVPALLRTLDEDRDELARRAAAAVARARETADHAVHVARVRALIGEAEGAPHTAASSAPVARPKKRVLFVSSNGAGVGHLMRLMSIARHAGEDIEPLFFTLSQAVPAVRRMGYPVEYMASAGYTNMDAPRWNRLLRLRLAELFSVYRPAALVFDGTAPYRGLVNAKADHPHVAFVWSRRGMWKPGIGGRALMLSGTFDLIVEPGELAEDADQGGTVAMRHEATRVGPIMYLDPDEGLSREDARRELGLDQDAIIALVQLGAGNINDISSVSGAVVKRLAEQDGLQVCIAHSIIGMESSPSLDRVKRLRGIYPLARYYKAFDMAVSACGYNTFHELIAFGVPTIFIPNTETQLDDQLARGRYAEDAGLGVCLPAFEPAGFERALEVMLDDERRAAMAERCRASMKPSGGRDAMAAIEDLLERWDPSTPGPPFASRPRLMALARIMRLERAAATAVRRAPRRPAERPIATTPMTRSLRRKQRDAVRSVRTTTPGRWAAQRARVTRRRLTTLKWYLRQLRLALRDPTRRLGREPVPVPGGSGIPPGQGEGLPVVMVTLWDVPEEQLGASVELVAEIQRATRSFRPVFVMDSDTFTPFREHGYLFEYVVPAEEWAGYGHRLSYDEYRARRLAFLSRTYEPTHIVAVQGTDAATQLEAPLRALAVRPRENDD